MLGAVWTISRTGSGTHHMHVAVPLQPAWKLHRTSRQGVAGRGSLVDGMRRGGLHRRSGSADLVASGRFDSSALAGRADTGTGTLYVTKNAPRTRYYRAPSSGAPPLSRRGGCVGSVDVSILHDLDRKRCGGHMSTNPMAGTFLSWRSLKRLWSPIVWVLMAPVQPN